MSRYQITRKLEFDAAHRVMLHESKCRNLHGHRYVAEITVEAPELDELDRVVDFSVVKQVVGGWLDTDWDHGTICNEDDHDLIEFCRERGYKYSTVPGNPTAEVMAQVVGVTAQALLNSHAFEEADAAGEAPPTSPPLLVTHVRLYETPNCWADWRLERRRLNLGG